MADLFLKQKKKKIRCCHGLSATSGPFYRFRSDNEGRVSDLRILYISDSNPTGKVGSDEELAFFFFFGRTCAARRTGFSADPLPAARKVSGGIARSGNMQILAGDGVHRHRSMVLS